MTPSTSYRIAVALEELSKMYPHWRFGQLVANVAIWAKGPEADSIWDVQDDEFLKAAEVHIHSKRPAKVG
jgi:hypothetical protein